MLRLIIHINYTGFHDNDIKGVPAVICEVLTPHGTIVAGSVEISLSMISITFIS